MDEIERETLELIDEQVSKNDIVLYMKGTPEEPRCGFSAKVVNLLADCGEEFAYVDVLDNPDIRQYLPAYSQWPTFPQLFVKQELVGGCDIVTDMHANGELQTLIKSVP